MVSVNDFVGMAPAAREFGIPTGDLCNMFFRGVLTDYHGPIIAGRRVLYRKRLDEVRRILEEKGKLPPAKV
jgi:hypothetical protein